MVHALQGSRVIGALSMVQPCDWLAGVVADVALPWARVLQQLLGDDLPEGLGVWVANLKAVVQPLLQRALELIDVAMGNQEE